VKAQVSGDLNYPVTPDQPLAHLVFGLGKAFHDGAKMDSGFVVGYLKDEPPIDP